MINNIFAPCTAYNTRPIPNQKHFVSWRVVDLHAVPCTEYSIGLVPNQKHFVSWHVVDLRAVPCSADTARADWWIGAHRSRHRRECASLPRFSLGRNCTDSASETLSRRHVCRDGHSNSGYPTAINSCRTRLGEAIQIQRWHGNSSANNS